MKNKKVNSVKLGVFVLAGLLFLVILLYLIGRNQNLFGKTYVLKAKFTNVQGLIAGNNVRFAGIQTGTVKKVSILNDTLIEITMLIDRKMNTIIHQSAVVSIGTEGFVGSKVVNIVPSKKGSPLAKDGDFLETKEAIKTGEMLETLSNTNNTVADIASGLKLTIQKLNNSDALWSLLNDKSIAAHLRSSLANLHTATGNASAITESLYDIVSNIKEGKGSVGQLLNDSSFAVNLDQSASKIRAVTGRADSLLYEINTLITGIRNDLNGGKGSLGVLLKDSVTAQQLKTSLDNIQKGTDGFNQNMEALKHSFFFRGYFRKIKNKKSKSF